MGENDGTIQDREEGIKQDEDIEEEMWQEAFGEGAKEGMRVNMIREGHPHGARGLTTYDKSPSISFLVQALCDG